MTAAIATEDAPVGTLEVVRRRPTPFLRCVRAGIGQIFGASEVLQAILGLPIFVDQERPPRVPSEIHFGFASLIDSEEPSGDSGRTTSGSSALSFGR